MPIDFHAPDNRSSYASREAHATWLAALAPIAAPAGKVVYDIGCGGGVYTRAWADLGAARVVGVDFSAPALRTAQEQTAQSHVVYKVGEATRTGLPPASADILFSRALIHHLSDIPAFLSEAQRLLRADGLLLIQARTPADVQQPPSPTHLRGYLFELFPRLRAFESARRHHAAEIEQSMRAAGFQHVQSRAFWETHQVYPHFEDLAARLRRRHASSILHELSDAEIEIYIKTLRQVTAGQDEITMQSRFTLWQGHAIVR